MSGLSEGATNGLDLVPAIGYYGMKSKANHIDGPIGSVSNITCAPEETETDPSLGMWRFSDASLELTIDADDRGPRSGQASDYESGKKVASGRHVVMVSDRALIGVVEGRTIWGQSVANGSVVVWRWSYDDIDQIVSLRIRALLRMRDVGVTIRCDDPKAVFDHSGLGPGGHYMGPWIDDRLSKAAKFEGSHQLGFVTTLANAVARHRGCEVIRTTDRDGSDTEDVFTIR